jgi:hypothetical protein
MWKRVTSVKKLTASPNIDGVQIGNAPQSLCGQPPSAVEPTASYNMSERTAEHLLNSIFCGYELEPKKTKGVPISPARIEREKRQLHTWLTQAGPTGQSGWLPKAQKYSGQQPVPSYYNEDWLDELAAETPEPTWLCKISQNHEKVTGPQTASQNIPLSFGARWSTPDIDWTVDDSQPG